MAQPKTMTKTLLSASLLAAFAALALPAHSAEVVLTVTTLADNYGAPPPGSLRAAINTANADPGNSYVINFNIAGGGTLTLSSAGTGIIGATAAMLPILTNPSGISINGANGGQGAITIHGGSTSATTGDRIFFIGVPAGTPAAAGGTLASTASTNYSISNLTLQNGNAVGGTGGRGAGGGAGLGGAVFVNAGHLTLSGVTMAGNQANGGAGRTSSSTLSGGGGGMGGAGATGQSTAGGGGFGRNARGGAGSSNGLAGAFTGAAGGGIGLVPVGGFRSALHGGGGSGGATNTGAAGGGVQGGNGSSLTTGGAGGFGGGGGGMRDGLGVAVTGGAGGYGGGGGSALGTLSTGGQGGFGGGAGSGTAAAGQAGFGGGTATASATGTGGGGAGLGGAVFVRQGATLTIVDSSLSGGTAVGGAGGANSTDGQGIGSGIFLAGSATYSVSAGKTVTIADTIGGGDNALITGGFTKTGDGTLVLTGANSFVGGTTVSGGVLEFGAGAANGIRGLTTVSNSVLRLSGNNSFVDGLRLDAGGRVEFTNGAKLAPNQALEVSKGATLKVTSNSEFSSGVIQVSEGGLLGGTGTVGAVNVSKGGTLAPGFSPGTLNTGNLTLGAGSIFAAEIDAGSSLSANTDLINVNGTISLDGTSTLSLSVANFSVLTSSPQTFLLFSNDLTNAILDPIQGQFGSISGLAPGYSATVNYAFAGTDALGRVGDGNDLAVILQRNAPAAAPVPGPLPVLGALAAFGWSRKLRRRIREAEAA